MMQLLNSVLCAMTTQSFFLAFALTAFCLFACKRAETGTIPTPVVPAPMEITFDATKTHQTIAGFGGFGAQNVYWSNGPFTSDRFVNDIITDLGCTIIRDEVPTSFEIENDNADPNVTDLSKYNLNTRHGGHHVPFGDRVPHLKALRAAGVQLFIASVWSPAPWMKWNNRVDNGTSANSAPACSKTPTIASNQLKVENYEEFAESCVAYCRIFKREIGIDLYGLSVQNEPRFSQSYQSCLYDGESMRNLIKIVGCRLKKEGLTTKLFMPEDVGWLDGVKSMTLPTLNDPKARSYVSIVATHGYALDEYSLIDSNGTKSKRYYISKQFYRYIRPGAVRVEASTTDADFLPLAFTKDGLPTLVISNVGITDKAILVKGDGVSTGYKVFRTSASENCTELRAVKAGESVTIPAQGVVTMLGLK